MNELSLQHSIVVGHYNIIDPTENQAMVNISVIENGKMVETVIGGDVKQMRINLSFDSDDCDEIKRMLADGDPDELFSQIKILFEMYRKKTLWSSALAVIVEIEKYITENYDDYYCTHSRLEYLRMETANRKMAGTIETNIQRMERIAGVVFDHYGRPAANFVTGKK